MYTLVLSKYIVIADRNVSRVMMEMEGMTRSDT